MIPLLLAAAAPVAILSPDHSIAISVSPDGKSYSVTRKGRPYVAVQSPDGLHSAWRVIMAGDRAGDLIASPIVGNLSQQASGDFSWVKPGKAAWDWWSGPMETPPPTMDRYRHFIDFAAQSGFPYFLIDAGWAYKTGQCCDL